MWITEGTSRLATIASRISRTCSGPADSPTSRLLTSVARTIAMAASRKPIAAVPMPSQTPLPVISVRPTPPSANTSPSSAPVSSSRITGSSGDLDRRTNCTQLALPRLRLDSLTAVRSAVPSSAIATSSTAIGTHCHSSIGCGSRILCHASYRANRPPRLNSTIATRKA